MTTRNKWHHWVWAVLIFVAVASMLTQSAAQPPSAARGPGVPSFSALDVFIESEMQNARIPGLAR